MRISLVLLLMLASTSSLAADIAHAKKLYQAGSKAYEEGKYDDALKDFQDAYAIDPRPAFWFNIGQCERKLGKNDDAVASYQKYLDGVPTAANRADVQKYIEELKAAAPPAEPAPAAVAPPPPPPPPTTTGEGPPWAIIGGVAAGVAVAAVGTVVTVSVLTAPSLGRLDLRGDS